MKHMILAGLAALALSTTSGAASADVIDFGVVAAGDAGNPLVLAGATFSALDGGFNMVGSGGICAAPTNDNQVAVCSKDLQVDFDVASDAVSFRFFGNNIGALGVDIGDVQVFNGAVLLGLADIVVTADRIVDLASFGDVTRLVISSTDFGGLLYDDVTFTPGGAVPEPSTWALMLLGFGGLGAMLRRRLVLA
jgi:hypothetical protein